MGDAKAITRCLGCGYTLAGLVVVDDIRITCPECGRVQELGAAAARGWNGSFKHWTVSDAALGTGLALLALLFVGATYVWFNFGNVQEFGFPMNTLGGWMFVAAAACLWIACQVGAIIVGKRDGISAHEQASRCVGAAILATPGAVIVAWLLPHLWWNLFHGV